MTLRVTFHKIGKYVPILVISFSCMVFSFEAGFFERRIDIVTTKYILQVHLCK